MRCHNCRFWNQAKTSTVYGVCHRYPPTLKPTVRMSVDSEGNQIDPYVHYPVTKGLDDWCGELHQRGTI
jgi:hypothetical protein